LKLHKEVKLLYDAAL